MILEDFVYRALLSIFCGFLIGLERQITGHAAGIRISVLVCFGSSLFVLFSILMKAWDVSRIAAQIVSGVGFLCSGIIFKDGVQVRGLNTAATIWCTAAIGVLSSSGEMEYALIATIFLLISNLVFRQIAIRIKPLSCFDESELFYKISIICSEGEEYQIRLAMMNLFKRSRFILNNLESTDLPGNNVEITSILEYQGSRQDEIVEELVKKISIEKDVTSVGWEFL